MKKLKKVSKGNGGPGAGNKTVLRERASVVYPFKRVLECTSENKQIGYREEQFGPSVQKEIQELKKQIRKMKER